MVLSAMLRYRLDPMKGWVVAGMALLAATGCHRDGETSSALSDDAVPGKECEWRSAPQPRDAREPLCEVEFREVVRLEGDFDGVIPLDPVAVLMDGRYLTATYAYGQLALWAPDGEFLDVMGNGPGEGPGEFDYASDYAQVAEDEFVVFTGLATVHWYSTTGRFLRSVLLPTNGAASAVVYDGAVIAEASTGAGGRGLVLRGDSIREIALPGGPWATLLLAAADDIGIWSAEHDRYVLRRHSWPSGAVVDSVVPTRDWFPGPEGNEGALGRLHADGRGLIWTYAGVADPDAPPNGLLSMDEESIDREEYEARAHEYRDVVIEALAPDGRLVASIRFDSGHDTPDSAHGRIWSRPTEDMLNLVILEAVLTEPG